MSRKRSILFYIRFQNGNVTSFPVRGFDIDKTIKEIFNVTLLSHKFNVQSMDDEVKQNKAGIVVETNCDSLSEGIKTLLEDNSLRTQIAQNANTFVHKFYNIENIAASMIEIYGRILSTTIR